MANASVLVGESGDGEGLRFLYRIVPGGADRSYGVQVAAMAGLPASLLARARQLLAALESSRGQADAAPAIPAALALDPAGGPLLRELAALDVDGLTPLEAISALYALRERARGVLPAAADPDSPPPHLLREPRAEGELRGTRTEALKRGTRTEALKREARP